MFQLVEGSSILHILCRYLSFQHVSYKLAYHLVSLVAAQPNPFQRYCIGRRLPFVNRLLRLVPQVVLCSVEQILCIVMEVMVGAIYEVEVVAGVVMEVAHHQ